MKIIELRAENVKRLRAVDITPDGTLQIVGGRNAQGKSSVLDAIWLALGGGKAAKDTTRPIRDGEERASVTVDLGDLKVTRSWTQKGTSLRVESADGAQYRSPQAMLDGLVGKLSFDPLEFTRLTAREQRDALLDLVDLDVDMDQLDAQRALLFEERTEIGRQGKAIGDVTVDESLPVEEQSAGAIIQQIRAIEDTNAEWHRRELAEDAARDRCQETVKEIERLEELLVHLKADLDEAQKRRAELPEPRDTSALEAQLATVEETNARIRANNQAREQLQRKAELRGAYEALTSDIALVDGQKAQALASAHFPVDGLGFDESGVTFQGVPFSQASSAEQIRVSIAMAMALNPKLRVLRIKDGSLLDEDTLEAIRQQVAGADFQLWLERVGNADEGAVIIEDGEVQS
jgi:DNA repair exonuclease SbcCD ATPase subunit